MSHFQKILFYNTVIWYIHSQIFIFVVFFLCGWGLCSYGDWTEFIKLYEGAEAFAVYIHLWHLGWRQGGSFCSQTVMTASGAPNSSITCCRLALQYWRLKEKLEIAIEEETEMLWFRVKWKKQFPDTGVHFVVFPQNGIRDKKNQFKFIWISLCGV